MRAYCQKTGQAIPEDEGAIIRTILESLALEYKVVFDKLAKLTGNDIEVIHILGGGSQNQLLNQMTANATGRPVVAGPIEATVIGNVLVQALAQEQIKSLSEGRALVARSFAGKEYRPQDSEAWQAYAQKATGIIS